MTKLVNPVTGHEITSDSESTDFWKAAGYRLADQSPSTKKTPAKKASPSKPSK